MNTAPGHNTYVVLSQYCFQCHNVLRHTDRHREHCRKSLLVTFANELTFILQVEPFELDLRSVDFPRNLCPGVGLSLKRYDI